MNREEEILKEYALKDREMDEYMYNDWAKQESHGLFLSAMQELARERAIGFNNFLRECDYQISGDSYYIDRNPHGIKGGYYTAEQLYDLYLSQLK
jgi:hypothetical protein